MTLASLIERVEKAEAGSFRKCIVCRDTIQRGRTEGQGRYAKRRFCSHACHYASLKGVLPETATDALLRRVEIVGDCHQWTGTLNKDGYGYLTFNRKHTKAHRLAYEAWVGHLPAGLSVCHRCDNRRCINPQHLFVGTNAENTADRNSKARQARGERCGRAKLTEADVRAIRASDESQAILAQRFGVGPTAINSIKARRSWAHVQ